MEIRLLTTEEAASACEVVSKLKCPMSDSESMGEFLANEHNHLIAATIEGRPVGFILGYELQRIDGQGAMMLLYEIEVVESHRRRGIGRALVEHLKRVCKERRFAKMFVFTEESNGPAMALYASTGGERGAPDTVSFWYPSEPL